MAALEVATPREFRGAPLETSLWYSGKMHESSATPHRDGTLGDVAASSPAEVSRLQPRTTRCEKTRCDPGEDGSGEERKGGRGDAPEQQEERKRKRSR